MFKQLLLILLLTYEYIQQSEVFFTRHITPSSIVSMFKKLNKTLEGKVGLKVHTGEIGGPYYLRPDFLQEIYDYTNGTFIECNTAYTSYGRHTTELHKYTLKRNGWLDNDRRMQIMDEDPSKDEQIPIPNHKNISYNIVGEHLKDFNSVLVLAHFKGHAMGGFGGALKQLSIGFASRAGKANIHSGGFTTNYTECWNHKAEQKDFTSAMADAASSIVNYFKERGGMAFINVMANISVRCDCGVGAPPPKVRDLGILASLDPVAIDRASFDLIAKENNEGSHEWIENSNQLLGENTLKVAEELGIGSQKYTLIDVDDQDSEEEEEQKEKEEEEPKEKEKEKEENYIFLYIFTPVVVLLLVIIGIMGFFLYKKDSEIKIKNASLGISMTSHK